jgi:predicted dehydrogenase/threonine dehydrogenase-like Zn-dependent dehydrogenase
VKQVVQSLRTGLLAVEDVPAPLARAGGVLVQTIASAVSSGTEKAKIDLARKNLLAKAAARPDQVRKVLATLRTEGVRATYHKIRNKLDALSPLGYSAAGRIVAVGDGCEGYAVGDLVACAGAGYANHAELIWVPVNLCARIPEGVALEQAAFTTLGAIALHGVRQAEAKLGESVAVIGLGLLGQLAVQLLRASGCRVIGIDLDPWKVELARELGCDLALQRDDTVVERTRAFTGGRGADAILITAAASSNDPIVLAGELARERAHVVIVGAVATSIPRTPYYEKELDVRMSRSYGPGRYDKAYEDKGLDYPIGYVRWTEQRNMEAFLSALAARRLDLTKLITHRVPIANAVEAYDAIGTARSLGIVLTYPEDVTREPVVTAGIARTPAQARVGIIGAGSFAGSTLLPLLRGMPNVALAKVCTASGTSARDLAIRHRIGEAVSTVEEILDDQAINAVVIATRHDQHAVLAARALAAGKVVFVEKPLALDRAELTMVAAAARTNPALVIGFNRRFSPHTTRVQRAVRGPVMIQIRVNAGALPADHWTLDREIGGGRLIGEGCHFIDLAHALAGGDIASVYAIGRNDDIIVTMQHVNSSVSTIAYTASGDPSSGKERIEVFGGGMSALIDDFRVTTVVRGGNRDVLDTAQDKGHREELARFVGMVVTGAPPPSTLAAVLHSSAATIAAIESLGAGAPIAP